MNKKHLLVTSILLLVGSFCSAATPKLVGFNDFNGTSWVVYGKNKISASKAGTVSAEGVGEVNFAGDSNLFSITDAANYTIYGTYEADSKGRLVVKVDANNIQNFFDDYVQQGLDDADVSYNDFEIEATSVKSTCKVAYSGSVVSLAITISAKAKFAIYYENDNGDEKEYHGNISFTLSVSGDHPVAAGASKWASKWVINKAKATLSTKKVKAGKVMKLELTLGDFGSSGLGLNQYLLVDPNSVVFSSDMQSDFCRSKNTVYFSSVESDINTIDTTIKNLILNNNSNVDSISIYDEDTYAKVTATVKDGKTISLTGTIYFWVDISYTDGTGADYVKGTLKLSGKGVPAK